MIIQSVIFWILKLLKHYFLLHYIIILVFPGKYFLWKTKFHPREAEGGTFPLVVDINTGQNNYLYSKSTCLNSCEHSNTQVFNSMTDRD